ncbi:MAG: phenylalanine--tRNA ligase subunit beta [Deltaproteobacteria bacterium]|nr:phenylalanine--tRNA ligase subunit beta [Deltaproteobacteria bacterium]MBW2150379.1 phenylalanine--tRNA ligase subunit beta [Deltaproteobacteria bacterium]
MKASFGWLKEYVVIEMSPPDLAEALTMVGLEVEALTDKYDYLKTVRVGRVVSVVPHPDAEHLKICTVDIGDRMVSVVCGAPNVSKGMLSALALPGTVFPDGTILQETVIRGQISEGMLCSEGELALGIDRGGVMTLKQGVSVGECLAKALGLSDPVIEIDLTPNRPDCLSILGIAREIAAIQSKKLKYPTVNLPNPSDDITRYTSVTIENPEHCPRYAARLLTEVTVAPSPFWIQDRLMSVGLRPINNIVDVTNYVMMETGQPLHAFDFDRLEEHRIVVRTAREGESFYTLDGKKRQLTTDMLMICDGKKPVAIGGVMGGLNSEVEPSTRRVLIEGAYFSPPSIRRTSRRLGLGTDASHRFERGVDPEGTLTAINRAAQLMAEVSGAVLIGGVVDERPIRPNKKQIRLSIERTNRFLGTELPIDVIRRHLESIEFAVQTGDGDTLEVMPPSFRVDINRPEDLMEEVARLSGYDAIPTTFPCISAATKLPHRELDLREKIKRLLMGLGYTETINYSFMNPLACNLLRLPDDDPRRRTVKIMNPLTDDQTLLRTTLVPGLLMTMRRNIFQQVKNLKLFEIGKVFINRGRKKLPQEVEMLGGLWTGARTPDYWREKEASCDFFDIKGSVEGLLHALKVKPPVFTKLSSDACHYLKPGYAAEIYIENIPVGQTGEIRAEVLKALDIKQPAYIFELDVHKLLAHVPDILKAKTISKFPATSRDVTLIAGKDVETGRIIKEVENFGEELIESIHLFDVFEGDPIPDGKKSVSFRITYRSIEGTLQDETINRLHKDLTERLVQSFNAALP